MVEEKKGGATGRCVREKNEYFGGETAEIWVRKKGIMQTQAGKVDKGIATFRAQSSKMVSCSKGKRGLSVKHHRKQGTP